MKIKDMEWLNALDTVIYETMSDPDLSAEQIAQRLLISRSQLYRKVFLLRGVSIKVYLQNKRFSHAKRLLQLGEVTSVKAAAHAVGMRKVRYFSTQFKERYGVLPSTLL